MAAATPLTLEHVPARASLIDLVSQLGFSLRILILRVASILIRVSDAVVDVMRLVALHGLLADGSVSLLLYHELERALPEGVQEPDFAHTFVLECEQFGTYDLKEQRLLSHAITA